MGDIHYVEQYIRLANLVQSALECLYKLCRELAYEAHGVTEEERDILNNNFPDSGVQCSEQLVFSEYVGLGQQIHDGTFTDVGISHERKPDHRSPVAPLGGHLAVNFLQLLFKQRYAAFYDSPVNLYLGLTHTASGSHTSSLALKVGPHAGKPWKHIVVPGQLNLHLSVGCLGSLGKYFQDQACAVDDRAAFDYLFNIPLLHPGKLIVEDDIGNLVFFAVRSDFFQFSASDISRLFRFIDPLHEFPVSGCTSGFRQEFKLIEVLVNLTFVFVLLDYSYEYGFLCFLTVCHP